MKNIIAVLSLSILATFNTQAQDAQESTISILKMDQPCVKANYNVSKEILSTAWSTELAKYDIKKSSKVKGGFRKYSGVNIPSISLDKIDLYSKMSGKKAQSTLIVLVSKGYDNFVSADKYPEIIAGTKKMMNGLVNGTAIAKLKSQIEKQAKVVSKAEKTQNNAVKAGKSLENEMKQLEKKIAENKAAQENTLKAATEEQANLKSLKDKLEQVAR